MYSRVISAFILTVVMVPTMLVAQIFDEHSIPDPTEIGIAASAAAAVISVVGSTRLVESDVSLAEVTVVEVATSNDIRLRAVRVEFVRDSQLESIYLDESQAAQFRDELVGFVRLYDNGESCQAMHRCVSGIARCRPSQTEQQAFCPSFYTTPDGKQGVTISTPRVLFEFPYVEPSVFISAIDAAIGELRIRNASE